MIKLLESILWLRERLREIEGEDAAQAVRQVRADLNNVPGPFGWQDRYMLRGMWDDQIDPAIRLELADLLVALDDPEVHVRFADCLKDVDRSSLLKLLEELDGHDLLFPPAIRALGFSPDFVDAIADECEGIFWTKKGKPKWTKKTAISGYHLIVFLAHQLGIRPERFCIGRGKHAGCLRDQIVTHIRAL